MQLPFSLEQFETYLMIFIRTGAIIFSMPLFGSRDFPNVAKIGLTLMIAWIIFPSVPILAQPATDDWWQLLPAVFAEIMIGTAIGFTARLIFEGIQIGGQLVGFQMGFGIVNVFDPISGANFSIISQFLNLLAILLFLGFNMHHLFFNAVALSFEKIPLFHAYLSYPLLQLIIDLSGNMFIIAVKVGAPAIAILLFTSVTLGIIAKTVPQVNVLMVGFPVKIAVGLFTIGLTLPMFAYIIKKTFSNLEEYIHMILQLAHA